MYIVSPRAITKNTYIFLKNIIKELKCYTRKYSLNAKERGNRGRTKKRKYIETKVNGRGFPGGAVVENLPANAGDTGSSPGLGRSHMLRSN